MTETFEPRTLLSRIKIPTVFMPKDPWPNPEASIRRWLCSMGMNKCWQAIGPAGQLSRGDLFKNIKALLECRHEYLNEGEVIPCALIFEIYMIGKSQKYARPHVMFSCQRKPPRQRAVKLVRESDILRDWPAIRLGDCSISPHLSCPPVQLYDELQPGVLSNSYLTAFSHPEVVPLMDDFNMMDWPPSWMVKRSRSPSLSGRSVQYEEAQQNTTMNESRSREMVFTTGTIRRFNGIPALIFNEVNDHDISYRKATIGGLLCINSDIYGLTVAHVFSSPQHGAILPEPSEMEFCLEDDAIQSEGEHVEQDFVEATSRGEIVHTRFVLANTKAGSLSSDATDDEDFECSEGLFDLGNTDTTRLESQPSHHLKDKGNIRLLGKLAAMSSRTKSRNLDWALIKLDQETKMSVTQSWSKESVSIEDRLLPLDNVAPRPIANTVVIISPQHGVLNGELLETVAFVQLPGGIAFQEMWTVRVNGPIC